MRKGSWNLLEKKITLVPCDWNGFRSVTYSYNFTVSMIVGSNERRIREERERMWGRRKGKRKRKTNR